MIDVFTLISKSRKDLIDEHNPHFIPALHTKKEWEDYKTAIDKQAKEQIAKTTIAA